MPLEREVLPNRPEAREKFLRAFRVMKAAHATLAFACRLVAVLCTVVQACSRFDENVLHMSERRNVSLRRRIAAQLVGDDLARHRVQTQQAL